MLGVCVGWQFVTTSPGPSAVQFTLLRALEDHPVQTGAGCGLRHPNLRTLQTGTILPRVVLWASRLGAGILPAASRASAGPTLAQVLLQALGQQWVALEAGAAAALGCSRALAPARPCGSLTPGLEVISVDLCIIASGSHLAGRPGMGSSARHAARSKQQPRTCQAPAGSTCGEQPRGAPGSRTIGTGRRSPASRSGTLRMQCAAKSGDCGFAHSAPARVSAPWCTIAAGATLRRTPAVAFWMLKSTCMHSSTPAQAHGCRLVPAQGWAARAHPPWTPA